MNHILTSRRWREDFGNAKGVIKILKWKKDRQLNVQKRDKRRRTNNMQKTKGML